MKVDEINLINEAPLSRELAGMGDAFRNALNHIGGERATVRDDTDLGGV